MNDSRRDERHGPAGHVEPAPSVVHELLAAAFDDADGKLFMEMAIENLLAIVSAQKQSVLKPGVDPRPGVFPDPCASALHLPELCRTICLFNAQNRRMRQM